MILNVSILLLYMFWAIVSLFSQGENNIKKKANSIDLFNIVPNYRFFCPTPTRYDYHLYYRSQLTDKSLSDWMEIQIGQKNTLLCSIWNPSKRDRKVFYKITNLIKKNTKGDRRMGNNSTYMSLVNFIQHQQQLPEARFIQFKITSKQDFSRDTKEEIIYTSAFYKTIAPR